MDLLSEGIEGSPLDTLMLSSSTFTDFLNSPDSGLSEHDHSPISSADSEEMMMLDQFDILFPPTLTDHDDLINNDMSSSHSNNSDLDLLLDRGNQHNEFLPNCFLLDDILSTPPLTPPEIKIETETTSSLFNGTSNTKPQAQPLQNQSLKPLQNQSKPLSTKLPPTTTSRGRSSSSHHDTPDITALKRHIRMIRNRESASLSRKKKKEYVTSLEERVKQLEREVQLLRDENNKLKLNFNSKINNKTKGLALLSIVCFAFVTFSSSSPKNYYNQASEETSNISEFNSKTLSDFDIATASGGNNIKRSWDGIDHFNFTVQSVVVDIPNNKSSSFHGNSNSSFHSNSSNSFHGNKKPKSTLRSSGNSKKEQKIRLSKTKNKQDFFRQNSYYANVTAAEELNSNKCADSFNKTESMRVQTDLEGLFSVSASNTKKKQLKKAGVILNKNNNKPIVYSLIDLSSSSNSNNNQDDYSKGLTIYSPSTEASPKTLEKSKYSGILEKLERRADTFYVVSLTSENQLLLSAKYTNHSSRPKITFLMPWRNETHGVGEEGREELMQIDCEVFQVFNLNKRQEEGKK